MQKYPMQPILAITIAFLTFCAIASSLPRREQLPKG